MSARTAANRRRPRFDDLPYNAGDPPYSTCGLYGEHDQVGSLNLLTASITQQALQEVETGTVIPLNLALNVPSVPMNPARRRVEHTSIQKGHATTTNT